MAMSFESNKTVIALQLFCFITMTSKQVMWFFCASISSSENGDNTRAYLTELWGLKEMNDMDNST